MTENSLDLHDDRADQRQRAWQDETTADLIESARSICTATTTCTCPDDPHQNALHDLAHDLLRILGRSHYATPNPDTVDGQANDCRHDSATGVDQTSPRSPDKVWCCDHCGYSWKAGTGR